MAKKGILLEVKVFGTDIKQSSDNFLKGLKSVLEGNIRKRVKNMHKEAQALMRAPHCIQVNRQAYGLRGYASGTGVEVPPRGMKAIHMHTGRMFRSLLWDFTIEGNNIIGEVGYDASFVPENPGRVSSLNWPETKVDKTTEVPFRVRATPYEEEEEELPTKYVPKVLLGSRKLVGRNILRRVLLNDIQDGTTITQVTRALEKFIASYRATGGRTRPGGTRGIDADRDLGINFRVFADIEERAGLPRPTFTDPAARGRYVKWREERLKEIFG